MKIVHISYQDLAASGYTLCHAINKLTKHKAINIRFSDTYLRYPTMVDASDYTKEAIRNMLYNADVIHFHLHTKSFYESLKLNPEKLQGKKKLVYFHGSELRTWGQDLVSEAEQYLGDFKITVSTPDLLPLMPKDRVYWLPVCRSFKEISQKYSQCNQDSQAVKSFGKKRFVTFGHAPTNVDAKGSRLYFEAITDILRTNPWVRTINVMNTNWDACLRTMSSFDAYFDQALIGSYGLSAVEVAIFKIPVIVRLKQDVLDYIHAETGFKTTGMINFNSQTELAERLDWLARRADIRRMFGKAVYDYASKVHDEKPVVDRYMRILGSMDK